MSESYKTYIATVQVVINATAREDATDAVDHLLGEIGMERDEHSGLPPIIRDWSCAKAQSGDANVAGPQEITPASGLRRFERSCQGERSV